MRLQLQARDSIIYNPLHQTAFVGHLEIVRLLCDRGADVEARERWGWRPLHWAAYNGHISILKELIEVRNAEINARDDGGRNALRWARYSPIIAAYLISHGGIE